MNRTFTLLAFASVLLPYPAMAQDIYLFDAHDDYRLVSQVTDRDGYDSQPAFTLDSIGLLFSSDRAGGQVDIFRYDIPSGRTDNITNTPATNEYSGQPWGAERVSFVLQEGDPYQNVWHQGWNGGQLSRGLTSFIPVGYYARNAKGVLLWARYAAALYFEPVGSNVGAANGESLFVVDRAGTSIHAIPGTTLFSFVAQGAGWASVAKTFDPETGAIVPLVAIEGTNQDYCWTPDGRMLAALGTRIRQFDPDTEDGGWEDLVSLEAPGLGEIGRCSVSPDGRYLAVVSTH